MKNWLQTGTEINAVIAQNDKMTTGAYKAIGAGSIEDDGIPVDIANGKEVQEEYVIPFVIVSMDNAYEFMK